MQTIYLKKTVLALIVFLLSRGSSFAQMPQAILNQADSLFAHKQYTESLQLYEDILSQSGQVTPAMLLRMAFVKESLGDYTKALYYLNLYYLQLPRQSVARKMEELASRYNLNGYRFNDLDFFFILYDRYYSYLVSGLLVVSAWLLIAAVRRKIKGTFVMSRHGLGLMFILLLNVVVLNLHYGPTKAIVAQDSVYLMSAPSAGAKLVRIVRKGNRLDIYGKQDIWLQTEWNGQTAYVRQHHVLTVP